MKKSLRLLALSLFLPVITLVSLEARASSGDDTSSSKEEFFQLAEEGNFYSFRDHYQFVEVIGTNFIGFELAYDNSRACLFGFRDTFAPDDKVATVATSYYCFPVQAHVLLVKDQGCGKNDPFCQGDPAAIAIGVGNIYPVQEGDLEGRGVTVTTTGQGLVPSIIKTKFPEKITIGIPLKEESLRSPLGPFGPRNPLQ